jgi:hypothetical protein
MTKKRTTFCHSEARRITQENHNPDRAFYGKKNPPKSAFNK